MPVLVCPQAATFHPNHAEVFFPCSNHTDCEYVLGDFQLWQKDFQLLQDLQAFLSFPIHLKHSGVWEQELITFMAVEHLV